MKIGVLEQHPENVVTPAATMRQAMDIIARGKCSIVLVCNDKRRLKGLVVDSDIRHAILRGEPQSIPLTKIMTTKPFVLKPDISDEELAKIFVRERRSYIPIVDAGRRLVDLARMEDYLPDFQSCNNWVVIMAGGQGTRLQPLTNDRPKPMMPINERPLLELAIERLVASGLKRFILSVNYLAEQIRDHFQDGSKFGAQIEYVSEDSAMGTAGALSLIKRKFKESLIVMNGDVLTKVNFQLLLEFHRMERNLGTLCVREYDFQVPYGVVQLKNNKLDAVVEKPVHRFFVNAGLYVLEPQVLDMLKARAPRDMPDLFEELRRKEQARVGCFPISEYWLDIGKPDDYKRALRDYDRHFTS